MTNERNHISICVLTYKRPDLLRRLLGDLATQETGGSFTYSIVVADNDRQRSAEALVADFATNTTIPVTYCVEPQQNITQARNTAIEYSNGEFIAFIDDDEFPTKDWLLTLYKACNEYDVDGVLGPVKESFDENPPRWVVEGKFYERTTYPTGTTLDWRDGRTGNVLLRKRVFTPGELPFRTEFHRGGDTDFFRRMTERGHSFIWCNEAVAYEVIPPIRWSRAFMLKRALLRGAITLKHPTFGVREIATSLIAIPAYAIALPFTLVFGQHTFMRLLVRLFDHLGKLLAVVGINPVKSPYATD